MLDALDACSMPVWGCSCSAGGGDLYENTAPLRRYLCKESPPPDRISSATRMRFCGRCGATWRTRSAKGPTAGSRPSAGTDRFFQFLSHRGSHAGVSDGHARVWPDQLAAGGRCFDLSRFGRLIDLGGATGHLAIAACERYPDLRAVVFDLPETGRWPVRLSMLTGADRIEIVSAISSSTRCPRETSSAWDESCTIGSESKCLVLCGESSSGSPGGAVADRREADCGRRTGPRWAPCRIWGCCSTPKGKSVR